MRFQYGYTRLSLKLQAAFGLRRAESIKIQPEWADRHDKLVLKSSWTKGGREREIPVRNEEQRQLLNEAKQFAGRGSLIPADKSYVDQLRRFEYPPAFLQLRSPSPRIALGIPYSFSPLAHGACRG